MRPWLAKTLLWSAIALVVLAGLWMVLDSKWSGELGKRRARETVLARELLPVLAPAEDAGPECSAALERMSSWMLWGAASLQLDQAEEFLGEDRSRPECWSEEQLARFALCDAPEVQGWLDEIEAGLMRPHCRLFGVSDSGGSLRFAPSWTIRFPRFLERECEREILRGNRSRACENLESAFALAAHAREVPTVGACEDSDNCVLRAISALRFFAEQGTLDATLAIRVQRWLASIQPKADWLRAIDGERVLYGGYAWNGLREGVAPSGISHPVDSLGLLYSKLLRPWRLFEELKYDAMLDEKRGLVAQNPWVRVPRPETSPLFQIARALNTFTELDGEHRLRVRHARDLAEIALRLAIAQAGPGNYPLALDALGELPREPITNQSYTFTRVGEGYTLALPVGAAAPGEASSWSVPR